jgi:hypothetical protein
MDRISAPPQNALLGRLADLLRLAETGAAGGPEFLPRGLDVMNLVRQLALPSAETVEKLSYGDPLFRMAPSGTGSRIPMTTDREYLADVAGMVPIAAPAAKPSARGVQELVRQIQTEPPVGAVKLPPAPGLLEKSDIGFYSQLESAVQPLQNKGTGQQYLAQIQKSARVKPEEIQWTGLDDFLKSKPSVTKQEIQDYLAANRVDVQEVRLGEGTVKPFEQWAADQGFGPEAIRDFGPTLRNSYEAFKQNASQKVGAAKYASETLPGGENYREILLTLPTDATRLRAEGDRISRLANPTPEEIETFRRANVAGASEFRSSHFDQPNILAHMRVNDRVVDGKKTLFIEEIQSDWHQAGRKKGYGPQTETTHEAYYTTSDGQRVSLGFGATQEEAAAAVDPGWKNIVDVKFDTQTRKVSEGVPDAPFKTSWHELSLKRAIQEASEKGYDQIAFTTGKTQAERYDLSKQVSRVVYNPQTETLNAFDKSGTSVIQKSNIKPDNLEDYIGKDPAQRLLNEQNVKTDFRGGKEVPYYEISGEDLKVGGEGMKGFYDNILPKSLEKLGKKFGAKVGKTEMDGVEVWQMNITPQMRESVVTKGQPLFAIPAIGAGLLGAGMMQEEQTY